MTTPLRTTQNRYNEMPNSLNTIISTGSQWNYTIDSSDNMHPKTTTLSANGSRNAPSFVTLPVALAIWPSNASLIPKMKPSINAFHEAPFLSSAERIRINKIGEARILVIVMIFAGVKISFDNLKSDYSFIAPITKDS